MSYANSGRNPLRPTRHYLPGPGNFSRTARRQFEGSTMDAKTDAKTKTGTLTVGNKNWDLAYLFRLDRSGGRRHRQALRRERHVHLRPRLHLDGELRIQDHLYRWRPGRVALSRLSDRAARRARRFPGDLLSAALRRIADGGAEGRFRLPRHPPHHGARADDAVLPGLPARRASDGGDGRLGRRAVGLLSRLHRHFRSGSAHDCLDPHDREDADASGHGL